MAKAINMLNNLIDKHFLKTLIIVFVLLFAFVSLVRNESEIEVQHPNSFLKVLPQKYANKLEKGMDNDSTYFSFTIENFGLRTCKYPIRPLLISVTHFSYNN